MSGVIGEQADYVTTVAADCLFVCRDYKTPKMQDLLRKFRASFKANLGTLQETPGTHPKWQEVKADNKGLWPYLELP